MAFGSDNNHGRVRQVNLNKMYDGRVSSQPSIQLSKQAPGLE